MRVVLALGCSCRSSAPDSIGRMVPFALRAILVIVRTGLTRNAGATGRSPLPWAVVMRQMTVAGSLRLRRGTLRRAPAGFAADCSRRPSARDCP